MSNRVSPSIDVAFGEPQRHQKAARVHGSGLTFDRAVTERLLDCSLTSTKQFRTSAASRVPSELP